MSFYVASVNAHYRTIEQLGSVCQVFYIRQRINGFLYKLITTVKFILDNKIKPVGDCVPRFLPDYQTDDDFSESRETLYGIVFVEMLDSIIEQLKINESIRKRNKVVKTSRLNINISLRESGFQIAVVEFDDFVVIFLCNRKLPVFYAIVNKALDIFDISFTVLIRIDKNVKNLRSRIGRNC